MLSLSNKLKTTLRSIWANAKLINSRTAGLFSQMRERWNMGANTRTITLALLFLPILFYGYTIFYTAPIGDAPQYVTIPKGSTLTQTVDILAASRVIEHPELLKTLIRLTGASSSIFAGDYYFARPAPLYTVYRRITTGAFGITAVSFIVKEGETVKVIAARCEKVLFRCKKASFIEKASSKEGYLFPDTYFVRPNMTEEELIALLEQTLYDKLEPYSAAVRVSEFSLHELLTLASIIEKEEFEDADRKMISGVLRNRIKINMPLQVDATFLYIMGKGSFDLSRKDLAHDSPYNTYVYAGLPPGPIGSPSLSSILAALFPTKNAAIFYLADSSGTTHYSKTYEEHLTKKRKYIDSVRQ
jgi:UPF0755 protein